MVNGQDAARAVSSASVALTVNAAMPDRRPQLEADVSAPSPTGRRPPVDPLSPASRPDKRRCILRLDAEKFASRPIDHPIGEAEIAIATFPPKEAALHTGLFDLRRPDPTPAQNANADPTIWPLDRFIGPTNDAVFGVIASQEYVRPTPDMGRPPRTVSVVQV